MTRLLAFWRVYRRRRMALLGLALVVAVGLVAALAPVIAPYGANHETSTILAPPSWEHLLGTDNLGRDVFSRIVWGARISFAFGFVVAGISLAVGVAVGAIAGYFGGWIDDVLSRVVEIFIMLPSLFLLIVVGAVIGHSLLIIMVACGLTLWPINARLTRAQVLSLKHEPYVEAARAGGVGHLRTLFGHILPNGIHPVIANSTLQIASAIILEASLSFLGVGDPNVSSWGQILKSGQSYLSNAPWITAAPGVAIFLFVFAFNVGGDGLNDALDPRLAARERTDLNDADPQTPVPVTAVAVGVGRERTKA